MANCAIYKKGTDEIIYFVENCVQTGRNFKGSNLKLGGVKEELFDTKWSEDMGEVGGLVSVLSEAKRYKGVVVSSAADIDRVIQSKIREKYSLEEELKMLRKRDFAYDVYNIEVDALINEAKIFKTTYFTKEV